MPLTIIATLINAIVLVVFEWPIIDHYLLTGWLFIIVIVTTARAWMTYVYHLITPKPEQVKRWEAYFMIGSIAAAMLWGCVSIFLFPETSIIHQVFVAFIVGGMSIGAVTSLSPLLLPIFAFLGIALSPLIARFFMLESEITHVMTGMLCVALIMFSASALRFYRNTKQSIELRIQNQTHENMIVKTKLEQQIIFDHAPIGIWLVDMDGRYQFVNKVCCDALGVPESKFLTATSLTDILGKGMAAKALKSDRECLKKEGPSLSHTTITFADGKKHLLEITKTKVKNQAGEVTGIIGIATDITERNLTEEKLRKLSHAVEHAGESIIITDKKGVIEYVNPSFTKITGYTSEEVMGKNPRILKSETHTADYYKQLWSTITSGHTWHNTVVDHRKDGSQYPAIMSIAPILNHKGKITHYVGIQQDMTDHEILEEKFRQSQKMEALGTLVGGIAHDFNNMLTGITGNLYLAKKKITDRPDVLKKLESIEQLSFRAAEMIKQLLTFSRRGTVSMKPFGLTSFMKGLSKLNEASIPENINFDSMFCHKELVVKGDATQLQQVLMNLLNNAHDAVASSPNPMISVTVKEFEADSNFINHYPDVNARTFAHLVIRDNGSGITDQDKEHIFEPFYTTKGVGQGTGLGLSMAYGAIKSHHGIIEVDNTQKKETSFHIYLPLIEEKEIVTAHENLEGVILGNGETILIVDDNADVRKTSKDLLESIGYRALQASNGLEAIKKSAEHQDSISLIIMDVVMPILGGVQAASQIKRLHPHIKIIFATGYDRDETLKSDMPSNEDVVLSKPYHIVELSHHINSSLICKETITL